MGGEGESRIYVFNINDEYLFKHYFQDTALFKQLQDHYDRSNSRFEVPESDFRDLVKLLYENGFKVVVPDDLTDFIVVVRKFTEHPQVVFRSAIKQWSVGNYTCFLLKNEVAVRRAVANGAMPLEKAPVELNVE